MADLLADEATREGVPLDAAPVRALSDSVIALAALVADVGFDFVDFLVLALGHRVPVCLAHTCGSTGS